jgi:hypothetical protein
VLPQTAPTLVVVPPGDERTETVEPAFVWTGPHTLQARFRMDQLGTYRTLVKTGSQEFTRGPAVTLPYSPEFDPRPSSRSGQALLADLAELSGGEQRADVITVFDDPPRSPRMLALLPWLVIAAVVLLLTEIAGRRLSLWRRTRMPQPELAPAGGMLPPPQAPKKRRVVWAFGRKAEKPSRSADHRAAAPPPQPAGPPRPSTADIFAQAKSRAKRRND